MERMPHKVTSTILLFTVFISGCGKYRRKEMENGKYVLSNYLENRREKLVSGFIGGVYGETEALKDPKGIIERYVDPQDIIMAAYAPKLLLHKIIFLIIFLTIYWFICINSDSISCYSNKIQHKFNEFVQDPEILVRWPLKKYYSVNKSNSKSMWLNLNVKLKWPAEGHIYKINMFGCINEHIEVPSSLIYHTTAEWTPRLKKRGRKYVYRSHRFARHTVKTSDWGTKRPKKSIA